MLSKGFLDDDFLQFIYLPSMRKSSIAEQEKIENNQDCSEFEFDSGTSSDNGNDNSDFVREENKEKQKRRKRKIYNTKQKGFWDKQQQLRFERFMIQNRQFIENKEQRRSNKIFKKMSKFVKTRSAEQCRSHHQKYEKNSKSFDHLMQLIGQKRKKNDIIPKLQQKQKEKTKIQPIGTYNLKRRLSDSSSDLVRKEFQSINGGIKSQKETQGSISYTILSQNQGHQLKKLNTLQFQLHLSLGLEFIQKYQTWLFYQHLDS